MEEEEEEEEDDDDDDDDDDDGDDDDNSVLILSYALFTYYITVESYRICVTESNFHKSFAYVHKRCSRIISL
jgi:hypothetical protein